MVEVDAVMSIRVGDATVHLNIAERAGYVLRGD